MAAAGEVLLQFRLRAGARAWWCSYVGLYPRLTLVLTRPPSAPNHCICRVKPVSSSRFLLPTAFGRYGPIHGKSS